MSPPLAHLLTSLISAVLLATLGLVIRKRGPRGLVNSWIDWNQVSPANQKRAGHVVGNRLLLMALVLLCHHVYVFCHPGDHQASRHALLFLGVGIGVLVLGTLGHLMRVPRDNKPPHGHR
ncbi:MAG: hypothetical protein ABW154_08750 [Dyella sp.]